MTPGESPDNWLEKSERDENVAARKTLRDADIETLKEMHAQFYALASTSVDRSKFAAETIQKSSASIAALYTAVLGVSFSVADHPLPLRGVLAPIFLGLAVVLSTAYLSYIVTPVPVDPGWNIGVAAGREQRAILRLNSFITASAALVNRRIRLLGAALASLLVGLIAIAVPFLAVPGVFSSSPDTPTTSPTAATSGTPDWPTAPAATETRDRYAEKLYEQKVLEAAQLREANRMATSPTPEPVSYFVALLLVGAAVVGLGLKLKLKP